MMRWLVYLVTLVWGFALVLMLTQPMPTLRQWWSSWDSSSLNQLQSLIQRFFWPELWTGFFVPLLQQPPWYSAVLIAFLLMVPLFTIKLVQRLRSR